MMSRCGLALFASLAIGYGQSLAADDNTAYGILAFSDDQYRLTNNIVTFDLISDSEPTFTTAVAFGQTSTAGAYGGRYYYVAETQTNSANKEVPRALIRVDLTTGKYTEVGALSGYENLINDMTYDWSTSTMYAVSRTDNVTSALYKIDLNSATSQRVAKLDRRFFTLAASYAGQLYGISFEGDFCAIDKTTGKVTVIAHTGHYPEKFQSMEFDHATRTLYWIASTRVLNESGTIEVPESFVATIDPATGVVTRHQNFGDNQLAGLYIPSFAAADNCPAPVTAPAVTPAAGGESKATLTWTNPTLTFGGEVLKTITKVVVERDGKTVGTVTQAVPGETSTFTDNIGEAEGAEHTWLITAYNANGAGASVSVKAFVGRDIPAAVTGISIEKLSPNSARISWSPVTTGVNGGWTNPETMAYDVVRNPGAVTVAEGLTATEWNEPGVEVSGTYSYTITARNSCGTSAPAESASITLGPKLGVPYSGGFDEDFGQWTPVDANADDNTWQRFNISWAKADGAYIMADSKDCDDWLVSNPFDLEPNSAYKVVLSCFANGTHPLTFWLVRNGDVNDPVKQLASLELVRTWQLGTQELQFTTGDEVENCNIAIHNGAAAGNSYMIIDHMTIEKLADRNLAATSILGNGKPVEGNTYGYTVTVMNKGSQTYDSFTVALTDAEGNIIASAVSDEPLEPAATRDVTVDYEFPIGSTLSAIRGKVIAEGDEIAADDMTQALELTVLPVGSPEELHIGVKKSTSAYHAMNLYSRYGASLNIYAASELSVKRGRITGVKLECSSGSTAAPNVGVKVYMANTDRQTAGEGWIPEEGMTLVYDGTIDIERGDNNPELTFSRAFDYDGRNLAMLVVTSLENSGVSYIYTSQPYYTSPIADNSAITYGDSNNPFAFSGNPYKRTGNSVITLMVQSGGASVTGKVTDADGNPIEGATVTIAEIHAQTTTAADGSYRFDFVPNAEYTLEASLFGYKAGEPTVVTVEDNDATADLSLTRMPVYSVSGRVLTPDGKPVADAAVKLNGYTELTTTTGADGRFALADVVTSEENTLSVARAWYVGAERSFALEADRNLGDITLDYAHFAPAKISAKEAGDEIALEWTDPSQKALLSYDSGVPTTQIGFSGEIGTIVIGSAFRTPMTLRTASWYTTSEGGPHNTVNIYIYDLDEDGYPTGDLLWSRRSVRNFDNQWNVCEIPDGVEAPRGCFVAVNYPGFHAIGVDGNAKTHPFRENTYAFSTDFTSGDFMFFSPGDLTGNLMIRAEGNLYSAEGTADVAAEPLPDFYRYNLRRAAGYDSDDWTLVNAEPTALTALKDADWAKAPAGVYRYAVTSVFPDGTESAMTVSDYIAHNMTGSMTLEVKTNSTSGSAVDAVVTISGADPADNRTAFVGEDGIVEFNDIWRDNYTLEIALPGYEFTPMNVDMTAERDVRLSDLTIREIIATPVNLAIAENVENNTFLLTWNESGEITEGFEDHVPFTMASAGEVGWTYRDGDGDRTFAEADFNFPGRTQPGSFMVFNPWMTTPSMAELRSASLPHSGNAELASFAAVNGSDDWFISPRLTYHNDFTFSFWARGYSATYGEVIRVGYSTTDNEPESFTWLSGKIDVSRQVWKEYSFTVPAAARYVAINSISPDGFALFIDDVAISSGNGMEMNTAVSGPEVTYEIALDGKKIARTTDCAYTLAEVGPGSHTATVKAVYASGESDGASIEFGSTAIDGVNADAITVAPNPAPGYTVVCGDFTRAALYDLSGRALRTFDGGEPRLDLSGIDSGLYVLVVETPAGKARSFKLTVR